MLYRQAAMHCTLAYCFWHAGADWKSFNAVQTQMRTDMVRLYGNVKRLIPPRKPWKMAGPEGMSINVIFWIQVTTWLL